MTSGGRLGRAVSYLHNDSAEIFGILNNVSISRNICLNFGMFTREKQTSLLAKVNSRCFLLFRPPRDGHQHGVSIQSSINLCRTLCQITRVRNTAQTWGLDRVLIYLSSIVCDFLDFIHRMVFDFYFDGVTVKTGNLGFEFAWRVQHANSWGSINIWSSTDHEILAAETEKCPRGRELTEWRHWNWERDFTELDGHIRTKQLRWVHLTCILN